MQKRKWLALYTRPRYEKKINKYLISKNITCYLPLIKTLRKWSDRKKWVELPLFTSYIFVNVTEREYLEVLNAPGAVRFVCFDGVAVEIAEAQIENIKWVLSTEIISEPIDEVLTKGARVEIIKGPLNGLKAEMVNYNNKKIIVLRIDQLDKSFEIQIPRNHVRVL
jgi:transcriptional antiterminator RfaH